MLRLFAYRRFHSVSRDFTTHVPTVSVVLPGYELCCAELPQPELAREEWKQMLCPVSGQEVAGRTLSSLGRLRMRSGHISIY